MYKINELVSLFFHLFQVLWIPKITSQVDMKKKTFFLTNENTSRRRGKAFPFVKKDFQNPNAPPSGRIYKTEPAEININIYIYIFSTEGFLWGIC